MTATCKSAICYNFEENNSERQHALKPMCNHRNLRLFDAQRRIISHQRSGLLYLCGARMKNVQYASHVCVALVCVQDMPMHM